ncbi:flagellar basal-body rod protein FlgC [Pseudomonas citronellolis]|jgi:flagellar basal-body rod protein FlgC|uniref:Flagellar basal-body rod protein FlgC n=1 Tax=Pseudomonas citronellolis TaxID=53408 RepID=A0A127MUS6_9PSED|nr:MULTISPECIES: flagellar basal body rod protein FlgC [Pseudomonas]AMO76950.1 Flagellar basal-body rod protein FlgC [Pseudomonas citronellolis]ANI14870.1 flagellar basal body rod protein FlgC [Pseudomonas citronellolis]KES22419.1 flagellar basal body rod protein FlgC [Pseudomonas sp. AAC]KRV80462.1 flagellar basal-body rod protein FlgC [Pseudomonas citronellolis]KRW75838.1 flagellar basal-body rod protein FlgC [Pseudomonas citronellolis]
MALDSIYRIAGSAMTAQTVRLNTVASNLANADSAASSADAAYKARKPMFAAVYGNDELVRDAGMGGARVQVLDVVTSGTAPQRRYEPNNPLANRDGYVYYPDVNEIEEMTDMMSATRSFETSVDVLNRVRSMQQGLLKLGEQS